MYTVCWKLRFPNRVRLRMNPVWSAAHVWLHCVQYSQLKEHSLGTDSRCFYKICSHGCLGFLYWPDSTWRHHHDDFCTILRVSLPMYCVVLIPTLHAMDTHALYSMCSLMFPCQVMVSTYRNSEIFLQWTLGFRIVSCLEKERGQNRRSKTQCLSCALLCCCGREQHIFASQFWLDDRPLVLATVANSVCVSTCACNMYACTRLSANDSSSLTAVRGLFWGLWRHMRQINIIEALDYLNAKMVQSNFCKGKFNVQ